MTDSSVELLTGNPDRLLRRVRPHARLDVPARMHKRLGRAAQLRLQFERVRPGPTGA